MNEEKPRISALLLSKKTVFSFMLSFSILYLLVRSIDINAVIEIAKKTNMFLYAIAFILHYLSIVVRGIRWNKLLQTINIQPGVAIATEMVFLSWFVNCIVPAKLGDVYRSYLLKKENNAPISASIGSIFIERVCDIAILLFLLTLSGLLIFRKNMPVQISEALEIGYILLATVVIGLVALWIFKDRLLVIVPDRFLFHFNNLHNGLYNSFSDGPTILLVITLTALAWAMEAARFFLVTRSLGLEIGFEIIIFIVLAASLLTAIPLTPAGLGAVEVSIVFILGIIGIDATLGTSLALLDRLISYWSMLVTGSIAYMLSDRT
ncbi:lysylphosphatidylglycerol synthase transmembrane domain-containing protein [uncultured Methanomethylovorans sp.]|uniref:lysylphosphatidylglycerol synthase transmembrane domain-containing protein n=1 Tax=uncultured Methanomethylovorans sp. TaxID=183759 RepID=UPI002AA82B42|nr:lysylphosphatidylglycerol synthase transmembrane domain-containing protein [uncultured Methanomethylovorans sp.]